MKIGCSCPRYQDFGLLYPNSERLQNLLCRYYAVVINLCKQAVLFLNKSFLSQIPSIVRSFATEFRHFNDDLERFAIAIRQEVSLASKQLQNDEADKNSRFRALATFANARAWELKKRNINVKVKSQVLDACSTYNHQTAWKQARKKGNASWIFEEDEYRAWRSKGNVYTTLWCTGILGSGKTILCANVVDDILLTVPTAVVSYFFCRYDEAVSLKARTVLGSIARQLISGVKVDFSTQPDLGDLDFLETSQILDLVEKLLPSDQTYFVIVDGIDECDEDETILLIDSLQRLLALQPTFHLYFSSRPAVFHRLYVQFQSLYRLSMPEINHEIVQYIDAELEQCLGSNKLCVGDSRVVLAIRDALTKGAQGM